jgi:ADP-ribose pyrophosphatase YjhB (NUDIX family)
MLPGGHPEGNETPQEALVREVWEEACAVVERAAYLGAQQVTDEHGKTYYQTRFWARVKLESFTPSR